MFRVILVTLEKRDQNVTLFKLYIENLNESSHQLVITIRKYTTENITLGTDLISQPSNLKCA